MEIDVIWGWQLFQWKFLFNYLEKKICMSSMFADTVNVVIFARGNFAQMKDAHYTWVRVQFP